MRGKRAKLIRKQASVVATQADYPEKSGYDVNITYWSTPARRIYRKMKREWSRKLT